MHLSAISDYTSLADDELDNAYAAAYRDYKSLSGRGKLAANVKMTDIGFVIRDKITGISGFFQGIRGVTRFPQYDAIQGELGRQQQVTGAQTSLKESAVNVAGNVLGSTYGKIGIAAVVGYFALMLMKGRK